MRSRFKLHLFSTNKMERHSDELDRRVARKTYLITFSRADKGQFTSKQLFANAVVEAFSQGKSKEHVLHWACGKEVHKEEGFHYHMAIKLSGNKVWLSAKRYLLEKYLYILLTRSTTTTIVLIDM